MRTVTWALLEYLGSPLHRAKAAKTSKAAQSWTRLVQIMLLRLPGGVSQSMLLLELQDCEGLLFECLLVSECFARQRGQMTLVRAPRHVTVQSEGKNEGEGEGGERLLKGRLPLSLSLSLSLCLS